MLSLVSFPACLPSSTSSGSAFIAQSCCGRSFAWQLRHTFRVFWYHRTSVRAQLSQATLYAHVRLARFVPFAIFVCSVSVLIILALLGFGFWRERNPISTRVELGCLGLAGVLWLGESGPPPCSPCTIDTRTPLQRSLLSSLLPMRRMLMLNVTPRLSLAKS